MQEFKAPGSGEQIKHELLKTERSLDEDGKEVGHGHFCTYDSRVSISNKEITSY